MFHPPQASVGLALLPVAWAATDQARPAHAPAHRNDDDLTRYFPAAWTRETLPDAPAAAASGLRRLARAGHLAEHVAAARRWLRRWAPGFAR